MNYGQDPKIGFKVKKKEKYKEAKKFAIKIKEILEKAKTVLGKAQEEIKKYTDKKREEVDEYKVGGLVILSTKDLKYQIVERRTEKLTERFIEPYKIKKVVSRIQKYIGQVEGQRKE